MEVLILLVVLAVLGFIMAKVAGIIWKDDKLSSQSILTISLATTIIVGLLDWYVIPAMGFSDTIKWFGTMLEPPLAVLAVIWLVRRSR